jgi:Zn-dependent metalloprotease
MVYGDGDSQYFLRFTGSLSIVAHELSHGIIAFTSNLHYDGESGALNESFCDVMGALVVQWAAQQSFDQANWVVGAEVLGPSLNVPGLRSFDASPAYVNHPDLGDDLQPKRMEAFVVTTADNGGVHLNSGIPNHAFYLAARKLGGRAWEHVGRIWYHAFTNLGPQSKFVQAAAATQIEAVKIFGGSSRELGAVREAWAEVGIETQGVA